MLQINFCYLKLFREKISSEILVSRFQQSWDFSKAKVAFTSCFVFEIETLGKSRSWKSLKSESETARKFHFSFYHSYVAFSVGNLILFFVKSLPFTPLSHKSQSLRIVKYFHKTWACHLLLLLNFLIKSSDRLFHCV